MFHETGAFSTQIMSEKQLKFGYYPSPIYYFYPQNHSVMGDQIFYEIIQQPVLKII